MSLSNLDGEITRSDLIDLGIATPDANGRLTNVSSRLAKYRLVSDGVTVTAYDKANAVVSSGTDGGAVLTACLPAAASAGAHIEFRHDGNVFPWGSVPGIAPGITSKLLIHGNGARIQLSSGGSRFLDLARTADYQTFQHIEVSDFVIDCNNIDAATHTVIGTRTGLTTPDQRVNMQDITVRRIRAINIPSTATGRSGINFNTRQLAGGEGTLNFVKDILVEDVTLDGGIYGFMATAVANNLTVTNPNILYDNIRFIRCKHTEPTAAPKAVNGACFQIGSGVPVGYALLRDCYGEYSLDVGIEIDNATADVEDCVMANCSKSYYLSNFATPQYPNDQSVAFRRCRAVVTDAAVSLGNAAFQVDKNNSLDFGELILDQCSLEQNNNRISNAASTQPTFLASRTGLGFRHLAINDCRVNIESVNYNNAASAQWALLELTSGNITRLDIHDFFARVTGTQSGAGVLILSALRTGGGGTTFAAIDGIDFQLGVTGGGAGGAAVIHLGINASTFGGSIRRVRVVSQSDTSGRGIRCGASLTVTPAPLTIEDCDFTGIGGTVEILNDATGTGQIIARNNHYKTKPAPVALTGLTTSTGKVLGSQASTVFWPCLVQFAQGSGAAVTAIDYSTNGGTTYTNLVTQASAALPAGLGPQIGPLSPADLVKVTFTTTQPTITLVPVNP